MHVTKLVAHGFYLEELVILNKITLRHKKEGISLFFYVITFR